MKIFFIAFVLLWGCTTAVAQHVGIGTNSPNASALLDIASSNKGILVPRMTTTQRTGITSPAKGLLVFDNDKSSFWFYNGTAWNNLAGIPSFPSAVGGQTLAYNGTQWQASDFLWNPGTQISINDPNSFTTYRLNVVGGTNNYDGIRAEGTKQGIYGTGSESGLVGYSASGNGVVGSSIDGFGMYALSTNGIGLKVNSTNGIGLSVIGKTNAISAISNTNLMSVHAENTGSGTGIYVVANSKALYAASVDGIAVYANSVSGYAGQFIGKTYIKSLGVDTYTPLAPLHVAGSSVLGSSAAQYISYGYNGAAGLQTNQSNPTWATGLLVDYDIVTRRSLVSAQNVIASDARIKNIVSVTNNEEDLETLEKIEVTNYTYKDKVNFGNTVYKKVIAQQVASIYPNAVRKRADFIPDIYALADIKPEKDKLLITFSNPYKLKAGDELKLIDAEKGELIAKVNQQKSAVSFIISNIDIKGTKTVFVYGKKVDDFSMVDYEALSVLNISATQALVKKLSDTEKRMEEIEIKLNRLSSLIEKQPTYSVNKNNNSAK